MIDILINTYNITEKELFIPTFDYIVKICTFHRIRKCDAEDIAQQIFASSFKHLLSFDKGREVKFSTYIKRITLWKIYSYRKLKYNRLNICYSFDNFDIIDNSKNIEIYEDSEFMLKIKSIIMKKEFDFLVIKLYNGNIGCGRIYNITSKQVSNKYERIISKLRKEFEIIGIKRFDKQQIELL